MASHRTCRQEYDTDTDAETLVVGKFSGDVSTVEDGTSSVTRHPDYYFYDGSLVVLVRVTSLTQIKLKVHSWVFGTPQQLD